MKKGRFWMWESSSKSSFVNQSARSWEEEAFAEDAAGCFGAFTWPPRCYICSFCTREFKSSQALGGHMNSHRRDKARLKQQSPSDQSRNCPSQISPLVYNQTVNTDETRSYCSFDHPSWSNSSASTRVFSFLNSKIEEEHTKKQNSRPHVADIFKSDLHVSLNLGVGSGNKEVGSCKRKRTYELSSPPNSFLKAAMEDLDLELKLGD